MNDRNKGEVEIKFQQFIHYNCAVNLDEYVTLNPGKDMESVKKNY